MAQAMTAIWSTTLATTATSISISDIPQTYRDLRLVMVLDNATSANAQPRFNGDSGNNYTQVGMGFNWQPVVYGTSNWASGSMSDSRGYPIGGYAGGNMQTWDIFDYSAVDKHKIVLMKAQGQPTSAANGGMDVTAQRWASNAAISNITVGLTGGAFSVGSTFTLYGIAG